MDMGGVQESRSWHCYRKKPLTPRKQVDKNERKEIHASPRLLEETSELLGYETSLYSQSKKMYLN